jgi:transcription termination/antitermination protein NusG
MGLMGRNVMTGDLDAAIAVPAWLIEMQGKELYAYRVQPGGEAQVMRAFRIRGIDGYVPTMPQDRLVKRQARWGGGERVVKQRLIVPMFPGLVFVPGYVVDMLGMRPPLHKVIDLLMFGDWIARLNTGHIERLLYLVQWANTPRSKRGSVHEALKVGDVLRIVDGVWRGFPAHFDGLDSKGRLSVLIQLFGRLHKVPIEPEQIEPV